MRVLIMACALALTLAAAIAPTAFGADQEQGCRDIISGDPIYATVGGDAVVDVYMRTAAPDCQGVRYGLKVRPANEGGPTGPIIAFSWQYGDGVATPEGQGEVHLSSIVPGAPPYVCVKSYAYRKLPGKPRKIFDHAPDGCIVLKLDGGTPAGGRSWD